MPRYEAPTSDLDRTNALTKQIATFTADAAKGLTYIESDTHEAQGTFLATWQPVYDKLAGFLEKRKDEVKKREDVRGVLRTTLRDLWEVLRRRVYRKKQPVAVFAFYQLPSSGETPDISTFEKLRTLARLVIQGDADAVTAGYPAMANPDARELQEALSATDQHVSAVPTADRDYDLAQAAVAALRGRMDELIDEGIKDIRNRTRKLDAPSQRRILRSYGARFVSLPGEPVEPPPPAAPSPTG